MLALLLIDNKQINVYLILKKSIIVNNVIKQMAQ